MSMREMFIAYLDKQIVSQDEQECPYEHIPNKRTKKAIKDAQDKKNLIECQDINDLIKKLGR